MAIAVGSSIIIGVWLLTRANEVAEDAPALLTSAFPNTDYSQSLVEFNKVLSGGVRKDGIPAISQPKFDPVSAFDNRSEDIQGILVEIDDTQRYYPFNILVSHEIVNDSIGDTHFAVTFCPLCGSAIVFNRTVDGVEIEFGVSGFLFESNLIMYDRTDTPSLWSQSRGEAIIGDQAGTKLDIIDFQLLTLGEIRANYSDVSVLSEDTGFPRNYGGNPYAGYEDTDRTYFPITVDDSRFPVKEVFYIVPQGERSVAIQIRGLDAGQSFTNDELGLALSKLVSGELMVANLDGEDVPGYYEMWFSWAQHHQDNGDVWQPQ